MKIIIVGSFIYEMYAPAFYNAWKDMGHEVVKIDYNDFLLKGDNIASTFLNKFQTRYHWGLKMRAFNHAIIESVNNFKPDLIFLYRCYHIYGKTVEIISKKTVVFSYNNDDPFSNVPSKAYFRHYIADARFCHLNYVYRKKNITDFEHIRIRNCKVLLPYYRQEANYYIDCEKDIPIAFLGHFENDGRDKLILSLKSVGLPVVVFGDEQWKSAPLYKEIADVVKPAKRGTAYNETINRCQILLVFFSKLNHDTYTRRCFEIPASKGVMLCEYTDDMNDLYPEDKCALYFRNEEELISKAKFLLQNPEIRERLLENAYTRLKELGGSEYERCQEIIEDFKQITNTI